jgi:hypothetical protein
LTLHTIEVPFMLGTNREFEAMIRNLDARIAGLERVVLDGGTGHADGKLEELWARRRSLRLLILNRQVEADKDVVDFQKWRDGNGAIRLCLVPPLRRRHANSS